MHELRRLYTAHRRTHGVRIVGASNLFRTWDLLLTCGWDGGTSAASAPCVLVSRCGNRNLLPIDGER